MSYDYLPTTWAVRFFGLWRVEMEGKGGRSAAVGWVRRVDERETVTLERRKRGGSLQRGAPPPAGGQPTLEEVLVVQDLSLPPIR